MPPTILIVDDALEELKSLIRFLETSGFQIAVAAGGESALNQISLAGQPLEFIGNNLSPDSDDPLFERSLSFSLDNMSLEDARDAFEQAFIRAALQKNAWCRGETSEKLGISPKALYNKIQKYGLYHGGKK